MKKLFIVYILIFSVSNTNAQEIDIPTEKKGELSIALHYAQHKYGDKPLFRVPIISMDYTEILDSLTIGKKVGRGVGLRVQYNHYFRDDFFLTTSANLFFYVPTIINYDWSKNNILNIFESDEFYHEILSRGANKGRVAYTANQGFIDVGVGYIPYENKYFNWRVGAGFLFGYHFYTDPMVTWEYDFIFLPDEVDPYFVFYGFNSTVLHSILYGGFIETSFNFQIVPDKFSMGLNYKLAHTQKYRSDGVIPQNIGVIFNVKM
jgi:hypothetical protein